MGAGVANATSGTADSRYERCQHAGHRHDRLTDAVDNALKVSPENLLALRTRTNS
jgi:hypothetical protein